MDIFISHRRHKIVKLILPNRKFQCLKIFAFPQQQQQKIQLYKQHFQDVKQWMKMAYSAQSMLVTLNILQINDEVPKQKVDSSEKIHYFKVMGQYNSNPTLTQFYQQLQSKQTKMKIRDDFDTYLYFIRETFQTILKGASINNFFYSPKNIFINKTQSLREKREDRLDLIFLYANYLSTVGLDLLFLRGSTIREDLQQIFPLLPTNLNSLASKPINQYVKELNRIIKMKAFAWNILSFIVRYVPNMLIEDKLNIQVTYDEVIKLLEVHQKQNTMDKVIDNCGQQIKKAEEITGINLTEFFKKILINNCSGVDWQQIYKSLFVQNKKARQNYQQYQKSYKKYKASDSIATSQKLSKQIIRGFWQTQKPQIKNFYQQKCIPQASTVYFLIRININFHNMMKNVNLICYLNQSQFSSDLVRVQIQLMRNSCRDNTYDLNQLQEIIIPYLPKVPRVTQPPILKHAISQHGKTFLPSKTVIKYGLTRKIETKQGNQIYLASDKYTMAINSFNRLWNLQ